MRIPAHSRKKITLQGTNPINHTDNSTDQIHPNLISSTSHGLNSTTVSSDIVLQLQRTVGNRETINLLRKSRISEQISTTKNTISTVQRGTLNGVVIDIDTFIKQTEVEATEIKKLEAIADTNTDLIARAKELDSLYMRAKKLFNEVDDYKPVTAEETKHTSLGDSTYLAQRDLSDKLKTLSEDLLNNYPLSILEGTFGTNSSQTRFFIDERVGKDPGIKSDQDVQLSSGPTTIPIEYRDVVGQPFPKGDPTGNDVIQGSVGDCWLLSVLISLANSPNGKQRLKNIIKPNNTASDHYAVTLSFTDKGVLKQKTINVRMRFPVFKKNTYLADKFVYAKSSFKAPTISDNLPLWPSIIENAFAKHYGSYNALDGNSGASKTAFGAILGFKVEKNEKNSYEMDEAELKLAVDSGKVVIVSTGTHNLSVVKYDSNNLYLRNPHGKDETVSWSDVPKRYTSYDFADV